MRPEKTNAWRCDACTKLHADEGAALQCCQNWRYCPRCGDVNESGAGQRCPPCNAIERAEWDERREARERAAFERAKKIPLAEYKHEFVCPPWTDEVVHLDEVLERLEDDPDLEPRDWVWGVRAVPVKLDADRIAEHWFDDHAEEVLESIDLSPLEAGVEAFNKANEGHVTYYEDSSTVVMLPGASETRG